MNVPTVLGALVILAVFTAIVARGVYRRRHGQSGCACGGDCGACGGGCHTGSSPGPKV